MEEQEKIIEANKKLIGIMEQKFQGEAQAGERKRSAKNRRQGR